MVEAGGPNRGGFPRGNIRIKCLNWPLGIRVDDIMTMGVRVSTTPGPLNQIA